MNLQTTHVYIVMQAENQGTSVLVCPVLRVPCFDFTLSRLLLLYLYTS